MIQNIKNSNTQKCKIFVNVKNVLSSKTNQQCQQPQNSNRKKNVKIVNT